MIAFGTFTDFKIRRDATVWPHIAVTSAIAGPSGLTGFTMANRSGCFCCTSTA
jgi:hypothetical protein